MLFVHHIYIMHGLFTVDYVDEDDDEEDYLKHDADTDYPPSSTGSVGKVHFLHELVQFIVHKF